MPRLAGVLLGDPPVAGGLVAGLAHARVEAEVGDEVACGREAGGVADRGHQGRRGHEADAWERHQPPHLREPSGLG